MKHFYHFYIAINNIENIDFKEDIANLRLIDKFWAEVLNRAKIDLTSEELAELSEKIKQSLS